MLAEMRGSRRARAIGALLAGAICGIAALCGSATPSARYSRDVPATCTAYVDTLPTAIPTEQWTPEWLSEFSHQHQKAYRTYSTENIDRFVDARGSAAGLERMASIADVFVIPLDAALQQSDRIVSGTVMDQWLASGTYDLVSRFTASDGTSADVHQSSGARCTQGHITLSHPDAVPLLAQDRSYAVLVEANNGTLREVGGYAYLYDDQGTLTPAGPYPDPRPKTLAELRSALDAAHGR